MTPPVDTAEYVSFYEQYPSMNDDAPQVVVTPNEAEQAAGKDLQGLLEPWSVSMVKLSAMTWDGYRFTSSNFDGPDGTVSLQWRQLSHPYGLPNEVGERVRDGRATHVVIEGVEIYSGEGPSSETTTQFAAVTPSGMLVLGGFSPFGTTKGPWRPTEQQIAAIAQVVSQ